MPGERYIPSQIEASKADEIETSLNGFQNELAGLQLEVKNNGEYIKELYTSAPRGVTFDHYQETMRHIDFSNAAVVNIIRRIPKDKRGYILYNAAEFKKSYHGAITDETAIQHAYQGKDESDLYLNCLQVGQGVELENFKILNILYKSIDDGKDPFHGITIPEDAVFFYDDINSSIGENRIRYFNRLQSNTQKGLLLGIERKYNCLFKQSIRKLLNKNPELSPESLFDNDDIFKLNLECYNVQQLNDGKQPLDFESLSNKDRLNLREFFKAELFKFGYKVSDVDEDILKKLEERDRLIREENERIMQQAQKINEELNNKLEKNIDDNASLPEQTESGELNYDEVIGQEIAESMNLSSALEDYDISTDSHEIDDDDLREYAFNNAWKDFIENHQEIAGVITKDDMDRYRIFDKENRFINKDNRNKFCEESGSVRGMDSEALATIFHILQSNFTEAYNSTIDELYSNSSEAKSRIQNYMKTSAIGSVIDNVRDIFSSISENFEEDLGSQGFKFNNNEPVKIQGDNLVISGEFNGANVMVRYNLKSGEVYMNSFLQYKDSSKMILGNDSLSNFKIGELKSFDDILSNHKLFHSQMTLLSDVIVENSKKQSAINSIVVKFMRTFNIIGDNQEVEDIEVNNGSDLFNFLQIINNSDANDLENLQIFMGKILEYAGLNWGKNNLLGPQENDKTGFENEYISIIRDSISDFSNNPDIFKDKVNFDYSSMFGFANMIVNKITDKEPKPNRKLDSTEMVKFIQHLENDDKQLNTNN